MPDLPSSLWRHSFNLQSIEISSNSVWNVTLFLRAQVSLISGKGGHYPGTISHVYERVTCGSKNFIRAFKGPMFKVFYQFIFWCIVLVKLFPELQEFTDNIT